MELFDSVTTLKGVGPKKADALQKLNIHTLEDLLFFFPRDYEDRRAYTAIGDLKEGTSALVRGGVDLVVKDKYRYGGKQRLRVLVSDDTGSLEVVFFHAAYLKDKFQIGKECVFYGKVSRNFGKLQMLQPALGDGEKEAEFRGIFPVYPLSQGLSQKDMRKWQHQIRELCGRAKDAIPGELIEANRLCSMEYALQNIHFPEEKQKLLEAKYRLVFDELLILQTGLFAVRQNIKNGEDGIRIPKEADIRPYLDGFSYELTGAQKRCIEEIERDLESGKVMNRLVQGDVGSGKTAVAEVAMYKAVRGGYQAVMMAPTEILAHQHFEGLEKSFAVHGIRVGFLSGSLKASEKRETLERLKNGEIDILVGTHAVIQPEVEFANLGLVITDEQHRFGVNQRIQLKEKGKNPNILVMTATPIPRTLAVVLYGDLDVSVIDEMPPGRQVIKTRNLNGEKRDACYDFVEKQLQQGRQAYVVTPLIEDSETLDLKSAQTVYEELAERFAAYNVALIHGSMKQAEKDQVMEEFYEGKIDVLVATVVIEVGINVPNASVIVIENAERFGLAQLHQLRGRVGRGKWQSYCFLITQGQSELAQKRGEIMQQSSDGFFIAEEDMKLRGPGDIFGTRQHGIPELNVADLARHIKILEHAQVEAKKILTEDPLLKQGKNAELKRRITKLFGEDMSLNL